MSFRELRSSLSGVHRVRILPLRLPLVRSIIGQWVVQTLTCSLAFRRCLVYPLRHISLPRNSSHSRCPARRGRWCLDLLFNHNDQSPNQPMKPTAPIPMQPRPVCHDTLPWLISFSLEKNGFSDSKSEIPRGKGVVSVQEDPSPKLIRVLRIFH